jgi:hypothetical protein
VTDYLAIAKKALARYRSQGVGAEGNMTDSKPATLPAFRDVWLGRE